VKEGTYVLGEMKPAGRPGNSGRAERGGWKPWTDEKRANADDAEGEFELSDGSSIVLSSEDNVESLITLLSLEAGPYRNETKEYGDQKYTAWVKLKSLGVTVATLNLDNHYSVGTYGLKMRYCSIAGTTGTALTNVDASCEVTDAKAEKVGYDMNATGTYKLTGKVNNGYIQIFSTIKLAKWNKTKKTVYVNQKYSYQD